MKKQLQSSDRGEFWFMWVLMSVLGSILGLVIGGMIFYAIWPSPISLDDFAPLTMILENYFAYLAIVGFFVGLLTGIAEWLVLREYLSGNGVWWILSNTIILGIFPAIFDAISGYFELREVGVQPALAGVLIGIAQWYFLRRIVSRAGWWVIARALGGVCYITVFSPMAPSLTVAWWGIGAAISGIVMVGLLKRPLATIRNCEEHLEVNS